MSLRAQAQARLPSECRYGHDDLRPAGVCTACDEAWLEAMGAQLRHIPDRVWQERPGEISWACSCGMVHKHQPFGELRCRELLAEAEAVTERREP